MGTNANKIMVGEHIVQQERSEQLVVQTVQAARVGTNIARITAITDDAVATGANCTRAYAMSNVVNDKPSRAGAVRPISEPV